MAEMLWQSVYEYLLLLLLLLLLLTIELTQQQRVDIASFSATLARINTFGSDIYYVGECKSNAT